MLDVVIALLCDEKAWDVTHLVSVGRKVYIDYSVRESNVFHCCIFYFFLHLSRVIRRLRRVMVETYAPPTFVRQDRPTRRVEFPNQTILLRDVGTTGEWLTHLTDYRARLYTRQPSIRSKQVG